MTVFGIQRKARELSRKGDEASDREAADLWMEASRRWGRLQTRAALIAMLAGAICMGALLASVLA